MINPASPGLEIYYLFHKKPVRGLILKYSPPPPTIEWCMTLSKCRPTFRPILCNTVTSPEFLLNGYSVKKMLHKTPPPYFIVSATCSSVSVCFIDYDPSVGNMGAVAGIKANTRADTGNSPNVVSILGQHLHSWHNIVCTGTL